MTEQKKIETTNEDVLPAFQQEAPKKKSWWRLCFEYLLFALLWFVTILFVFLFSLIFALDRIDEFEPKRLLYGVLFSLVFLHLILYIFWKKVRKTYFFIIFLVFLGLLPFIALCYSDEYEKLLDVERLYKVLLIILFCTIIFHSVLCIFWKKARKRLLFAIYFTLSIFWSLGSYIIGYFNESASAYGVSVGMRSGYMENEEERYSINREKKDTE